MEHNFSNVMRCWKHMCDSMETLYGDSCCKKCPLGDYNCGAVFEMPKCTTWDKVGKIIMEWEKNHTSEYYPTWLEVLINLQVVDPKQQAKEAFVTLSEERIPKEYAEKLGISPKYL